PGADQRDLRSGHEKHLPQGFRWAGCLDPRPILRKTAALRRGRLGFWCPDVCAKRGSGRGAWQQVTPETFGYWAAAVAAAILVGLSKGGLPVIGMMAVPVLALFMSPI